MIRAAAASLMLLASAADTAPFSDGIYRLSAYDTVYDGIRYHVTGELAIERVSPKASYVGILIEYPLAHECQLGEIADREGAALVYRETSRPSSCVLTVHRVHDRIVVEDRDNRCAIRSAGCMAPGYPGILNGASFSLRSRRSRSDTGVDNDFNDAIIRWRNR